MNTKKLDSLFNSLARNNKAMGNVLIMKNGKSVYSKSIGFSHERDTIRVKNGSGTRFRIGTVTQLLTATMIIKLIEEGKLKGEDKLVDYFPDIPNSNLITINNLLQHRSGIYDYLKDSVIMENLDKPVSREYFFSLVSKNLPEFDPNTKQSFTGSNYVLLGYLIEDITGKNYGQALKEIITDTLKLKSTFYGGPPDPVNGDAYSYIYDSGWFRAMETHPSVVHASGGVISTTADMSHFITALFQGKIISMQNLEYMIGPSDQYSLGVLSFEFANREFYGLIGNIDAFMTSVLYDPDSALAITYFSNGQNFLYEEILDGIFKICFNEPYTIPVFKSIPTTQEQLKSYTGDFSIQGSPVKLKIYLQSKNLYAKLADAEGIQLIVQSPGKFMYETGGSWLEFSPDRSQVTLVQGSGMYLFVKE